MKTFAIFLVLPALILAKIDIDVIASDDESQRQVHVSGSNVDLISDQERDTFQLSEENLKSAVSSHFSKRPDDVFVKSPTPWGDLYVTNEWKQVSRILKPLRAKILSISYRPIVVSKQFFNNTSSMPAIFKTEIKQDVENTVASFWERSGELSAEQYINYGFDIKAMAVSGKATLSYKSKWGENVMKSQIVTVGSKTAVEIPLQPNQAVTAYLNATVGSMKVEIDYEATLSGSVVVNYADLFKDHHFWSIDVNKVLTAGGLKRSVLSSEVIDLSFYADSRVDIHDSNTNEFLFALPLTVF